LSQCRPLRRVLVVAVAATFLILLCLLVLLLLLLQSCIRGNVQHELNGCMIDVVVVVVVSVSWSCHLCLCVCVSSFRFRKIWQTITKVISFRKKRARLMYTCLSRHTHTHKLLLFFLLLAASNHQFDAAFFLRTRHICPPFLHSLRVRTNLIASTCLSAVGVITSAAIFERVFLGPGNAFPKSLACLSIGPLPGCCFAGFSSNVSTGSSHFFELLIDLFFLIHILQLNI